MKIASTTKQDKHSLTGTASNRELQDAGKVINVLLLSWKNYLLYPEGHGTSVKALANMTAAFDVFLQNYSSLRLAIERDKLLYGDNVLHEAASSSSTEDLVFLLYRDGLQWLEFSQGLSADEIALFFRIIDKNKVLDESAGGDIVTALIDAELEHIHFKAVDIFWQNFPLIDFSKLETTPPAAEEFAYRIDTEDSIQYEGPHRIEPSAKSIADPSVDDTLWNITDAEFKILQQMVLDEENWDNTEDVFDVLMVILSSQKDRENFAAVLNFTREEVIDTIEQGEFQLLLKLFQSLHKLLYRDVSKGSIWLRPLIHRFFYELSSPEIFRAITVKLLELHDDDLDDIKVLRQILLYFSPEVIISLGPVLSKSGSFAVLQMVLEVIEFLCYRDIKPLEKILEDSEPEMADKLLVILSRLRTDKAKGIFFKMLKNPSARVRTEAVRKLVAVDSRNVQKFFSLIDDPSPEVRTLILSSIAKQRSTVLESMMLKYMKEDFDQKNPDHILACYEALGRCGTDNVIPYLQRILLGKGWNRLAGYGKPIHREGAALALALLESDQTKDVFLAASKSRFRVVREAFRRAMKKNRSARSSHS